MWCQNLDGSIFYSQENNELFVIPNEQDPDNLLLGKKQKLSLKGRAESYLKLVGPISQPKTRLGFNVITNGNLVQIKAVKLALEIQ